MKKYVLSVLLLLLSAMLFSCGTEAEAPRGILERMVRAGNDLPATTGARKNGKTATWTLPFLRNYTI